MADLYRTPSTPSSNNQEDISSYFQPLHTHNSTASSTPENMSSAAGIVAAPDNGHGFGGSRGASSSGVNMDFSDPASFFKENGFFSALDSDSNASYKRKAVASDNDVDDFSCDSEGPEASELPLNPPRPRSSSKRTRAAEVHNLSEKRRRSRINEKMKALQSLIPNSNKTDKASMLDEAIDYLKQLQLQVQTDKASMLDEAIDYLKQLQLQVQMLTMRNGLGLPPMYSPGTMQPLQLPGIGRIIEDTFLNQGTGITHANQENSMQTVYSLTNHCTPSSQSPGITSLADLTNIETSYGFDLPVQVQFEQLNPPNSSKEICRENSLPQAQVDTDQCCNNSSSGLS